MTQAGGTATLTGSLGGTSSSYIAEILGRRLGNYRLERALGSGGMGTVYSAVDERYGTRVAVKMVPTSIDETRLRALKREFRMICEFSHPHVVEVYDLGVDAQCLYTAMELIEGEALVPFLLQSSNAEQRQERALRAASQLAQGLAALHEAGFLHCDLKSPNILVNAHDERVVIVDFGLAERLETPAAAERAQRLLGTPSHMAPELLRGSGASKASDWFAWGVTWYEVLVGRPTRGQNLHEIALAELKKRSGWEGELLSLVADLLHPVASERPDAGRVFERLGLPPAPAVPHSLATLELVGREPELARLEAIWDGVVQGRGATVALSGPAGVGKTFLASSFVDRLEQAGAALVCRSRCHANERIPFNAVDRLADALARHVATLRLTGDDPSGFAAVTELFPSLGDVHGFRKRDAAMPDAPSAERRVRAFGELRRLVTELARLRPLIFYVDDAQWADADSARLLQEVCGVGEAATPAVLLLWTARAGHGTHGFLSEMQRSGAPLDIEVGPLTAEAATRLALALMPRRSAAEVEAVVREASGNPLVLVKAGQARAPESATHGGLLKALVEGDLAQVGLPLRRLMSILAIASAPLAADIAFRAADAGDDVHRAIAALRRVHLIAQSASDDDTNVQQLELYHETLREPLTLGLVADERAQLHAALARTLEASPRPSPSLLATHFHAAQQHEKAARYAEQAGTAAASALAFAAAAAHFRDALAWGTPAGGERVSLNLRLAESLFDAGQCAEAGEIYATLRDDVSPADAPGLAVRQATAWFSAGYVDRAMSCVDSTLRDLGIGAPADNWLMPAIAARVLELRLRGADYVLDASEPDAARAFRADACWAMGQGLSMFLARRGAYFALRSLREAGPLGDPRRIGRGLAFLGGICANLGPLFATFGEECLSRAEAIAKGHGDSVVLGWTHVWRANTQLVRGQFRRAVELAEAGTDLMEQGGYAMSWECHTARCFALMARERLGDLQDVARRALDVLQRARARRDFFGQAVFGLFAAQVALVRGSVSQAEELAQRAMLHWTEQHFTIQHFYALRLRVLLHLYVGDAAAAWTALDSAWPRVQRSDAADLPSARLDSIVLRAQVELALAARNHNERAARLRSVRKLRAHAEAVSSEGRAHALLIAASEQRVGGADERARTLAHAAATSFERLDMALWARLATRAEHAAAADARAVSEQEAELLLLGVGEPARWAALATPGF